MPHPRPAGLRAAIALAPLLVASGGCGGCGASRQPNVVLVTVDTLRADHCSLYGYGRPTTPTLDGLGAKGIVYDEATATASYTMASVGSILTGQYPWEHGANSHGHPALLSARSETLAEVLKARGYRTMAVVTNPILKAESGYAQGFDSFVFRKLQLDESFRPAMNAASTTTDLALQELASAAGGGAPFFLWVHYMDPHWWYTPPPPYDARFGPPNAEWDAFVAGVFDGKTSIDAVYFRNPLPPAALQRGIDLYDGEIAYTDAEIGRLLAGLDARGLTDRTLVAVTADHGESLGQHGITFCHGFFTYEDNLRVPLVIVPPRKSAVPPQRNRTPTSLVELKATILFHLGLGEPPRGQYDVVKAFPIVGESEPLYGPSSKRPNIPGRPRAYVEGEAGKWRSIREGPLKLIQIPRPEGPELELYDLSTDPDEQRNIEAERPADRDRLLETLRSVLPPSAAPVAPPAESPAPITEEPSE